MKFLNTAFLIVLSASLLAEGSTKVYRAIDENGDPVFSDVPIEGATVEQVAPIQTFQAPAGAPAATPAAPAAAKVVAPPASYTIKIISPENEATLPPTEEAVPVQAEINPPLKDALLAWQLDGVTIGNGTSVSFLYPRLDRGAHLIAVVVVDAKGNTLAKSSNVVVNQFRASNFNKPK